VERGAVAGAVAGADAVGAGAAAGAGVVLGGGGTATFWAAADAAEMKRVTATTRAHAARRVCRP
jgi:hypothetical protein